MRPFLFLSCALPLAVADVKFTSPGAGKPFVGGGALSITWTDSKVAPLLSDLISYQLFLCAGGNDAASIIQLDTITTTGTFALGNNAEGTIAATLGDSTKNAYFLKMISVASEGGTVINYSDRFTLTGMTGVFPANVIAGISAVTGTSGPDTENNVGAANTNTAATAASGSFALAFAMQTGPIRYAPMQSYPGTAITKKTKTPLNPTSPYTIATTFLPPAANIQSTATAAVTWSFSQIENTIAAAATPTDDMQRFLNRWKD